MARFRLIFWNHVYGRNVEIVKTKSFIKKFILYSLTEPFRNNVFEQSIYKNLDALLFSPVCTL